MTFIDRLDELMRDRGYTRGSFAKAAGIPYTTVVGFYDKGYDNIKLSTLRKIADFFGVSIEYLCGDGEKEDGEIASMVKKMHGLTAGERGIVSGVIEGLMGLREDSGHAPVAYIKEFLTPAAAGNVSPAEGDDYVLIPRDDKTPENADFAVRIDGDSMEPYIPDGGRVYVSRSGEIQEGDVGIFFADGNIKCKQYYEDSFGNVYLFSANRKRADADTFIPADSDMALFCFGKVLLDRKLPKPKP